MEMVEVFEQLFENRQFGAIGANVVDDTEDIVIPYSPYPPPPPEEFPWLMVAIVAGVAIVGAVAFTMFKK